jgi:hypothetical protein
MLLETMLRLIMKTLNRTIIVSQIDVYMEWGVRHNVISREYGKWLELFVENCPKTDILDVDEEDVNNFRGVLREEIVSGLDRQRAELALKGMRKFYEARSKNGHHRMTVGRPPSISEIRKAQEYRKKGLTIGEIGKIMGKYKSQVHRWIKYPLNKD